MVKRKGKKVVKQPAGYNEVIADHEAEHRVAALQAIRDVEVEHLLTGVRLLRSNFNKDQLEIPLLRYFEENMPNLELKCEDDGQFQVEWKDNYGILSISQTDDKHMHASLLQRMQADCRNYTAPMPHISGHDFSMNMDILGVGNFRFLDFAMKEPSETQMVGGPDVFRTPGENSQRLSVGMTPKTLRLPKKGEMLLSVRGSPLGVYNEKNMEAINEVEEG